jgi:hypothetical protein
MQTEAIPLLVVSTIVALLFLLLTWNWWQIRRQSGDRQDLLVSLLLLGIVAFGAFLIYALFGTR